MNRRTLLGTLLAAPVAIAGGRAVLAQDMTSTPEAPPMAMHGMADTGTGAAFLTVTNSGDADDRLVSAVSDAAVEVQIHDMVVKNDVMSMVELEDGLVIPAGESVVLAPKGLHIMLIGLNESLMPDSTFDITLTFEQAGEVTVTALVTTEMPSDTESWTIGDLEVSGVWSRPAPKLSAGIEASPMAMHGMADTGTGAAFLTITNSGDADDRLVSAASDAAVEVQIHDMIVKNDVMSMVELEDGLEIPAGESVVLAPKGLHIMLIGLNESLMPDSTFDITLTFEQAGEVTVTALVATEIPTDTESWTVGDLEVSSVWSRPAPKLSAGMEGTPDATPAH